MKTRNVKMISLALLAMLSLPAMTVFAADKAELQKRFKERFPQLLQLMKAGTIGETDDGMVAAVKSADGKAEELMESENADRLELYKIIAEEQKTTPDKVAVRNAQRTYEKLPPRVRLRPAETCRQN